MDTEVKDLIGLRQVKRLEALAVKITGDSKYFDTETVIKIITRMVLTGTPPQDITRKKWKFLLCDLLAHSLAW